MICAVTYQFRGWLATIMANKRRQRTVLTLIGVGFMVVSQLPNLIIMQVNNHSRGHVRARILERQEEQIALHTKLTARQITPAEFSKQSDELRAREVAEQAEEKKAGTKQIYDVLEIVNLVLPIGWIASGAKAASDGNPWPGIAGAAGMAAITFLSLRRSYTTTLRYFTGSASNSQQTATVVQAEPQPTKPRRAISNMIEWSWPLVSEPVAVIAWTTFRSLTRSPQVKMILFGPCIMMGMYVVMIFPMFKTIDGFSLFRSLMPMGVLGLSISSLAALSHNGFSFDRSGFRSYVLSGVPRRDILFGKNLALVPFVFVATIPILIVIQCFAPAPLTHFLAILLEIPTTYLTMSLLGNVSSIMTPICQPNGAMKPANFKPVAALLQLVFGLATLLVIAVVGSLPIGLELFAQMYFGLSTFIPLALIVAAFELAISLWYYFTIIRWQGELLQSRECRILEIIIENGE
jgi:ABC-2 type transport system permease protein